jgi:hypothetical protein
MNSYSYSRKRVVIVDSGRVADQYRGRCWLVIAQLVNNIAT